MRTKLVLGGVIVCLIVLIGPLASFFAPDDPRTWQTFPRNLRPSLEHFLGTTSLGQDTFWLLSWSVRNSLLLGVSVGALATVVGVAVGLLAGYRGGVLDRVLSFLMDGLIVIPSLPLLILLSSMSKGQASLVLLGGMLVLFNWPFPARQVRSVALSLRERDFVSLAWLGLSNDAVPTLGTMIYWALKYQALFAGRWAWILPPIFAVMLIFIGFFLLSNALSDRLRKNKGAAL